jgi:hypothetical protein
MLTRNLINFLKFTITWIASNLSIPFWVVGHVHLTVNIYEDIHEIIASFGMNIIVAIGFIIEYKTNTNNKR